jgi:hypothetical protein
MFAINGNNNPVYAQVQYTKLPDNSYEITKVKTETEGKNNRITGLFRR